MNNKVGYFFELKEIFKALKQVFKGRFLKLLGLLLLIALPIAIVDGYTNSTVASSVMATLPSIDFNSPSSVETILTSISTNTQGLSSTLLSLIITLLHCAILIIATVFTWQCLTDKNNLMTDSTAFAKHILRKLPIVFLISYLSSYVLSTLLSISMVSLSVLLAIPVTVLALPLAMVTVFLLSAFITAIVDSYSSVMVCTSVMGRVRFMFSMLYTRLLYKGNFVKTMVYYSIINVIAAAIGIIPYGVALVMSYFNIPAAFLFWGAASAVQCIITGLVMCIYTARMLQLEKKNISLLRPMSFVVMDSDNNGNTEDNSKSDEESQNHQ